MVRFSDSTCFDEITEPAIPIFPVHELLGLANTNTQLPDIIGEITAAKSTVTDPPHDKNHLMATIKMDNDVSVTMSMFDSQPVKLHNQLESMGGDPRVLVATSLNPKIVGGHLFLNATSGTRIYFDKETIAGETSTGCIADLNEFVNSASSQEIDFICTEKVTGIKLDKGWCYVSCSNCTKKLQRTVSAFTCLDCNNTNAVGVLKTDVSGGDVHCR
ncbi:BnaA02g25420D [Brassica napus]|uniref:BnaA02g25420D protein n=1 Tax=Brassica napus TaxID=3708 RepID=A0A078GUW5_BRANA|nr:BnaA02g25420D [Brassica napus]